MQIMSAKNSSTKQILRTTDSLGEDAYEWLLAAITSFRIPTNSQISENKLAMELGISRTPVREALMRLESEGLVQRGDAGRFIVPMLTSKDVDEAIDLLTLCDSYLFQRASENINEEVAASLRQSPRQMMKAANLGNRDDWMKHDNKFHEAIIRAADNDLIAEVSRLTRRRIQRFWARSASGARDLVPCSQEHIEISDAVIAKDLERIRRAVEHHLSHLRQNMQEIVESMAPFFGAKGR
ncbi:MAG: GntR family transcriptional regulator [Actinobacteria bacterium]|nr:GntR family transcriptional regulator [Actinomycetota bacterium]NBO07096.1 GntR family transcriptional regulator [Actinomycetota bacterium]NBO47158.1 GntR family transcriptional regulator [Actinomycetota bacterium]NBP11881.1 GntR family transcriptional regulator [Actinomycetota bacterium]NBP21990.1 GntR family transcriptional regulator [Actinomycetota bacterium]